MKCCSGLGLGRAVDGGASGVQLREQIVAALERSETFLDRAPFRVPFAHVLRVLPRSHEGPVAQLVEQGTFNPKVVGSSPTRPIRKSVGNGARQCLPHVTRPDSRR